MRTYLKSLNIVAVLFALIILVLPTPTHAAIVSDALAIRSPTGVQEFSGPAITFAYKASGERLGVVTTDLAILKSLQPEFDNSIVVRGFATAAAITAVTCATAQPPPVCIAGAVTAVFTAFFSIYQASGSKRALSTYALLTDYPPTNGCGTVCHLKSEAPEGGWRLIGNFTANGVFHSLHYSRAGNVSGLRAVEHGYASGNVKRGEANDGGVVVDYLWNTNNMQAYDSFDSTPTSTTDFADDVVTGLEEDDDILGCANFEDSDGILAPGLMAIGWNNQPFEFQDGESAALLGECANIN
ncbi:hypothetical protein K439DRAFT_1638198 [Ramaria rubella]|nr:hypothetical protein K439DRAFT_1638198 [Ramaria rubella]